MTYTPSIKTSHVYPPIPVRSNDWCAYDDRLGGDCSPYGWGPTREAAIADFFDAWETEFDASYPEGL